MFLPKYFNGEEIKDDVIGGARGMRGKKKDVEDKPEGKRRLGRSRRRWYVIKMDLKEIGSGLDLSGIMQGQVARS